MKVINTDVELNELVLKNEMVIIYFNGVACGACEIIKGKIEEILSRFPKIKFCEINGEQKIDIAVKYNVFSLPIMLLYIEGKETLRIGRNVDFLDLEKQINRYYKMIFQ